MSARVVVVGGGVSGLTVAYRLLRAHPTPEITVLESDVRPGGRLTSVAVGGLWLPAAADSFVARKLWAADLCRELGLELEGPRATGAYLWTPEGLVPMLRDAAFGIPADVGDVLRWPGVSRRGRRRALLDLLRRAERGEGDRTLGGLLRRRLGDEATERAVAPLLEGLFAGDADRLSLAATFPELAAWERVQGSLIRGSQAARRQARNADPGPVFLRPRGGIEALPAALVAALGERVRTASRATSIARRADAWTIETEGGPAIDADAVVLAGDGASASMLLEPIAPDAAAGIGAIPAASTGVVLLVYARATRDAFPDGTGFVVPRGSAPMTACTWLSNKWAAPAFEDRAVARCFVGGVGAEDLLGEADGDLIEACARHLAALVDLPSAPEHAAVVRWPDSMPQYEVGHLDRVARIRRSLPAGIFVIGQPYDGVGIADCVRAASTTAEQVIVSLDRDREHA